MKPSSCKLTMLLALCLAALLTLASCGGVLVEVQFIVDGEVYETITTTGKETVKVPTSPTKEGYEFKGWYWDLDKWEQPFTANSLLEVPITDNMRVYARFEKIGDNNQNPGNENPDPENPGGNNQNQPTLPTLDAVKPEVGKAYHLAMLHTKVRTISYANGKTSTYYLAGVTDIAEAVNVYIENSTAESGKYFIFAVVDGERQYINLVRDGNFNNAVYADFPVTSYRYDEALKTMVGTVNGAELVIGTNSEKEFLTFGTRYLDEPNCVAQFVLAKDQSATIPPANKPAVQLSSISDIIAGNVGTLYKAEGIVMAVNAQSFLIEDESGMILVYKGATWTPDVLVGDILTVEGPLATYGNAMQFGTATEYERIGSEDEILYPAPNAPLSAAEIDEYLTIAPIKPEFVSVIGTLSISGNYYNLVFDNAELMGTITYPTPEIKEILDTLDGTELVVSGYITGVTGNQTFLNIMMVNISLPAPPDQPTFKTLAEVLESDLGFHYSGGYVVGVNAQSFLLYDESALMLVYKGEAWDCDLSVGDMVLVAGTTIIYGKAVQFGTDTVYEKLSSTTISHGIPTELTVDQLNYYQAAGSISPVYTTITGTLTISGSYYNVYIDGANVIGSISYPDEWNATVLTALNGKTIKVTGYITGVTGKLSQYLNILAISFEEVENTEPQPPFEGSIADAKEISDGIPVVLSGTVLSIDTPWNDATGCMTVTITDGEDSIKLFKIYTQVALGDVITVRGTIGTYAGNRQVLEGATAEITGHTTPIEPTEMTIPNALLALDGMPVIVTGTVVSVDSAWNETYGNMNVTIADDEGNLLYVYRLCTPVEFGDVITVTGNMATFNGERQIAQGATAEIVEETPPTIPDNTLLIMDIIQGTLGETYKAQGVVIGVNAQSFLISDGSGIMLVYKGASWVPDVAVGDRLNVTGPLATYANAMQFGIATEYEKIGTEAVTYPAPAELSAGDVDVFAYENPIRPQYVKITGTLVIDGSYYNLVIEGASLLGSITYPTNTEVLAALNGQTVEVVGYVTGVAGSRQYLSIMAIEVVGVQNDDNEEEDLPDGVTTIADIKAANNGEFTALGVVVGVNAQSFLLMDDTGLILVYKGSSWTPDVEVGDKVTVSGLTTVYGGAKQFGNTAVYEKNGTEAVTYPSPVVLTAEELDAYASMTTVAPLYVKIVGTLSISNGRFYNVTIAGAAIKGSVTYPIDTASLAALDGKTIEVIGYITGVVNGGLYLNLMATSVAEAEA